jgi:hypothetical protein
VSDFINRSLKILIGLSLRRDVTQPDSGEHTHPTGTNIRPCIKAHPPAHGIIEGPIGGFPDFDAENQDDGPLPFQAAPPVQDKKNEKVHDP